MTFTAGAAAAADIVACTAGTFGFAAGTANTADDADTTGTADGAAAAISTCCTVASDSPPPMAAPSFSFSQLDSLELLPSSPAQKKEVETLFCVEKSVKPKLELC